MTKWLNGTRDSTLMVLLWTVGWGLGFGGLAELIVDPSGEIIDIWPFAMAVPGFVGGIIFALLLWIGEGRRPFDEVSLVRFTGWGVVTGLALAVISIITDGPIPLSLTAAEMIGLAMALSAVAAIASAIFCRLLGRWDAPAAAGRAH